MSVYVAVKQEEAERLMGVYKVVEVQGWARHNFVADDEQAASHLPLSHAATLYLTFRLGSLLFKVCL